MSSEQDTSSDEMIDIRDKLNTETGKLTWAELERHYARGKVIRAAISLDLIDVAAAIAEDNAPLVAQWMQQGLVAKPLEDEVLVWVEKQPLFWAVVVSPWVIVQEAA